MINTTHTRRTCKNRACRNKFEVLARHPFAIACCEGCEIILSKQHIAKAQAARASAEARAAKADRKETKIKLQALKGLSYWEGRAQHAVNTYIRARDEGDGCISCGITYSTVWQAGHYIAVGANSTLRYLEDNIHLQCVVCNHHKGGNVGPYRINLLAKIGQERVETLEAWHAPVKSTIEQCQVIEAEFKRKLKVVA
jgi:hypothetical protein